jgi:hypothetical protein
MAERGLKKHAMLGREIRENVFLRAIAIKNFLIFAVLGGCQPFLPVKTSRADIRLFRLVVLGRLGAKKLLT